MEPTGLRLSELAKADGIDDGDVIGTALLNSVVTAAVGLRHVVSDVLVRLESEPKKYLPLWDADTRSFLLEQMRMDPPAPAMIARLPSPRSMEIAGQLVHFDEV